MRHIKCATIIFPCTIPLAYGSLTKRIPVTPAAPLPVPLISLLAFHCVTTMFLEWLYAGNVQKLVVVISGMESKEVI